MDDLALRPRPVSTVDELLRDVVAREPLSHSDSKSGAPMERVRIGDQWFVTKVLDVGIDWTMRAVGDLGCKTLQLWRAGLLDALPESINQPIIGCAHDPASGPGGRGTVLLMRDVGEWMVPEGDAPIPLAQHLGFLDHMAEMQARFWDFEDVYALTPLAHRYLECSPWTSVAEAAIGADTFVPKLIAQGWERFPQLAPEAAAVVMPLLHDLAPLVDALEQTPMTLLHGNWKLGNLGTDADGRTVLIDWEVPGRGPGCSELVWYLSLNAARLPHAKEDAIACYRDALERHGIETGPWWDRQLALALLGGLVQMGWEKALGGAGTELDWWAVRAVAGARHLA
ncbi:MAG: aminoglycoside phosphotransferase [Acidimicrobiia bacterium]